MTVAGNADGCESISVYVDLESFECVSRRGVTCLVVGKNRAKEGKHTNTHSLPSEKVRF